MTTDRSSQSDDSLSSPSHAVSAEVPTPTSRDPADAQASNKTLPISSSQHRTRHHLTNVSRKLSGRPPRQAVPARPEPAEPMSSVSSHDPHSSDTDSTLGNETDGKSHHMHHLHSVRHHPHLPHHSKRAIISQVTEWLHQEKTRQAVRKSTRRGHRSKNHGEAQDSVHASTTAQKDDARSPSRRNSSDSSDSALALQQLEQILTKSSLRKSKDHLDGQEADHALAIRSRQRSRKSSLLVRPKPSHGAGSESDSKDLLHIPSAEVVLDNSQVCSADQRRDSVIESASVKFNREIIRLTHTLRISGWRRVRIEDGDKIEVSRLSGALTNAVYVVKPPPDEILHYSSEANASTVSLTSTKKRPRKLLLRIYGPQVEHLIDRDAELQILRRLSAKQIGPTLLGTFTNGRFEKFLEATTLTAPDIRIPQTSMQIAKRMRELHDGIDLLRQERSAGPFVWQNWDKYKERCEEVIGWLDEEIMAGHQGVCHSKADQWKNRGLVCGVEWPVFRAAVRKYRDWLYDTSGGEQKVKDRLVFAHNDTQYGNLMRMQPSGESPLLLPENSHKQLVVIDFEYANANVPGMEFVNHFSEWCYDYHADDAFALHEGRYPKAEEQHRFIKAYVQHVPPLQTRRPELERNSSTAGSLSQFMLDSRTPRASSYLDEEAQREQAIEQTVQQLLQETRIWRMANAAQWVAWGIVQAKVPGMDTALEARRNRTPTRSSTLDQSMMGVNGDSNTVQERNDVTEHEGGTEAAQREGATAQSGASVELQEEEENEEAEEDEFDYLAYAQERALLFWGDALQLGIVERQELPECLLKKVKVIDQ